MYSVWPMRLSSPIAAIVLLFGLSSLLRAQTGSVSGGTGGVTTQPGTSGASTALGAAAKNTSDPNYQEKATDQSDDTLYRGKTSEAENPMLRDEGPLHFKTRKKEKVQEVNSLNNLQRSGAADKAFEGNLLHSSVSSIEDVVPSKAKTNAKAAEPRFSDKSLTFVREKSDGRQEAQTDSTPSPTPSPTASARSKDSSQKN